MARRPQLIVNFSSPELAPLIRQIAEFEDSLKALIERHQDAAGRSKTVLLSLLKRIRRATEPIGELIEDE